MKTISKAVVLGVSIYVGSFLALWFCEAHMVRPVSHSKPDYSVLRLKVESSDTRMWNGEHLALQPGAGYRAVFQPYNPQHTDRIN
jgi:hypothetical protein